jgi:hypothetical protein
LGTRLLPLNDDSHKLLWSPGRTRAEIMVNQAQLTNLTTAAHLCLGLFNYVYLMPPLLILCLFKVKGHVCLPKMAKDELKCLLCIFPWCVPHHVINLLALHGYCTFICYVGEIDWTLTYGSPGIWAWDLKLWFQHHT